MFRLIPGRSVKGDKIALPRAAGRQNGTSRGSDRGSALTAWLSPDCWFPARVEFCNSRTAEVLEFEGSRQMNFKEPIGCKCVQCSIFRSMPSLRDENLLCKPVTPHKLGFQRSICRFSLKGLVE
jgi:hypothetical protein